MTEQTFDVTVKGCEYQVYTSTDGTHDQFRVTTNDGALTITDNFGECNPLRSAWGDHRYRFTHGAARRSMENRCVRESVEYEIEAHADFCRQLIEDDLETEEQEAHSRARSKNS